MLRLISIARFGLKRRAIAPAAGLPPARAAANGSGLDIRSRTTEPAASATRPIGSS